MNPEEIYCEVHALYFDVEKEHLSTRYQILINSGYCELKSKTITNRPISTVGEDWKSVDLFQNGVEGLIKIFEDLRQIEISSGLYVQLQGVKFPKSIYQRKAEQFVDRIEMYRKAGMSDKSIFTIYGNTFKYEQSYSKLVRADFIKDFYGRGICKRNFFKLENLNLQQLVKYEIALTNSKLIHRRELAEVSAEDFLRGYYPDFEPEIDFYKADFKDKLEEVVTVANVDSVISNFLSYNVIDN